MRAMVEKQFQHLKQTMEPKIRALHARAQIDPVAPKSLTTRPYRNERKPFIPLLSFFGQDSLQVLPVMKDYEENFLSSSVCTPYHVLTKHAIGVGVHVNISSHMHEMPTIG